MANTRWATITERLKAATSHDFERRVLPVLRIKWPDLAHPKSLGTFDCRGIDLVLVGSGSAFEVVVQCKGFELPVLGESQIAQVRGSIEKFQKTEHSCDTYVLVHNRTGIDETFRREVQLDLDRLVQSGKAKKAWLWDLSTLVKELNQVLTRRIVSEIERLAQANERVQQSKFLYGDVVLENVPHSHGRLSFPRHDTPRVSIEDQVRRDDPLELFANSSANWTIIFGAFGSGKSTLSRRLAELPGKTLLYVPAAELKHIANGGGSENQLACQIIEYLGIFDEGSEFSSIEGETLAWLAGPLLAARLRDQNTDYVLLIDAIDENRFYSSVKGFRLLTTELSRVSCDVILTTRREHFRNNFVSYTEPLGAVNRFATEEVRLIELHHWGPDEAIQYVDSSLSRASGSELERLQGFRETMVSGAAGELAMQHPLFLAMTADLVASDGNTVLLNRSELYRRWIERKLVRDFEKDRCAPTAFVNIDHLISEIFALMMDAAVAMTEESASGWELVESLGEPALRELAIRRFGPDIPSDLYATTSLMEPIGRRVTGAMKLRFFHQSFHEYFLAQAVVQKKLDVSRYPEPVRSFAQEIDAATLEAS